jgi:lipoprotein-anchoring transpeptidase ErfK/SrfK
MADRHNRRFVLPLILAVLAGGGVFAGSQLAGGGNARPVAMADVMSGDEAAADESSPPVPFSDDGAASETARPESETARRILVSLDRRMLWLVEGSDTLMRAPVAIGMGKDFTYNGRKYHFSTPRGERTVRGKARDPLWIPPDWHYYEKAVKMGLDTVVRLDTDARVVLGDSSFLVVKDDQVGRINHFGNFAPFTPGTEIVFDRVMYIPPLSTAQRRVPDALGPFKLDMGDGYLIHGTHLYNEETIGEAVSHGCVRMRNEDITRLFPMVPVGTTVTIF